MKNLGITIVELLISMAIVLIILGLLTMGLITGGRTVMQMYSQSELLEDSRYISQLMADGISRAVYVYPPGVNLTLQSGKPYTVHKPGTSNNVWTVGTNPIIAFIEAPQKTQSGVTCADTDDACLHFVAFYPVLRSSVVSSATGPNHPGEDPANASSWMLFEYRTPLSVSKLSSSEAPPTTLTGGVGNILADYLSPNSLVVNYLNCRNTEGALETCATSTSPHYRASVQSGEVMFQSKMKRRKDFTTPVMSFALSPRNLYSE